MTSNLEADFTCPVCYDIFKDPIVLSCSHSVCNACLDQFWKTKGSKECPVCRTRSTNELPNLALKNLCETYRRQRGQKAPAGSEGVCSLHSEKFRLFCLDDKQPACVVCRDSRIHANHKFQPLDEVISDLKVRYICFNQLLSIAPLILAIELYFRTFYCCSDVPYTQRSE